MPTKSHLAKEQVFESVKIDALLLDHENPRLPAETSPNISPDELLELMWRLFKPLEVAESIARNGFFLSEPLIAVKEGARYVVVEGNRRLAALKLLLKPDTAIKLSPSKRRVLKELSKSKLVPRKLNVLVVPSRKDAVATIGYRHISGVKPWKPREKARFVFNLVTAHAHDFEKVGEMVGESATAVKELYRNYRVADELVARAGVDASVIAESFGVFTRAMQDTGIRAFIGLDDAAIDRKSGTLLGKDHLPQAREFCKWALGPDPLFSDSRKLPILGRVVRSKRALVVLRETGDLEEADFAAGGVHSELKSLLTRAARALERAAPLIARHRDDALIVSLLKACEKALVSLKRI